MEFKQDTDWTRVLFRKYSDGGIIAIFPYICGDTSPYTCASYMHLGQHGACDPRLVIANTQPAKPTEFADLKRELESEPYGYRFKIGHRLTRDALSARKKELSK